MATKGIGRVQIEMTKPAQRWAAAVALAVLAVLVWAWWDGGEEPLRPIAQQVGLPESGQ